jgi:AcrR family transcriptional regulator
MTNGQSFVKPGCGSPETKLFSTPMPHPRTKPPEERRDDLMNAAQQLFIENGVAATTIDQIAAGARIAKGTFYLYFSSKEDVLAALRERFVRDYLERIKTAVTRQPEGDWRGRLASWVKAGVEGYIDTHALHDVVFHEPHHRPDERPHGIGATDTVQNLTALLAAGTAAKAWSVEDPAFTALALFNALHGAVHDTLSGQTRLGRAQLIRAMEGFFFSVVGLRREAV